MPIVVLVNIAVLRMSGDTPDCPQSNARVKSFRSSARPTPFSTERRIPDGMQSGTVILFRPVRAKIFFGGCLPGALPRAVMFRPFRPEQCRATRLVCLHSAPHSTSCSLPPTPNFNRNFHFAPNRPLASLGKNHILKYQNKISF